MEDARQDSSARTVFVSVCGDDAGGNGQSVVWDARDRVFRPGALKNSQGVQEMELMTWIKSHQFRLWDNRGTQECSTAHGATGEEWEARARGALGWETPQALSVMTEGAAD